MDLVFSVAIHSPLGSWEEVWAQPSFRLIGDDSVRSGLQTMRRGQGETEELGINARLWELLELFTSTAPLPSEATAVCYMLLFSFSLQNMRWTAVIDHSAKRQQPARMRTAVNKWGSGQGTFLSEGKQNWGLIRNFRCHHGTCWSSKADILVRDIRRSLEVRFYNVGVITYWPWK